MRKNPTVFRLASGVFRRMIRKKLRVGPLMTHLSPETVARACVISSPSAWDLFQQNVPLKPARVLTDAPMQLLKVQELARTIKEEYIVGIGGGRVVDCAKAVAKLAHKQCTIIPSILSTTAWLNGAASLKDGPKVHHTPGRADHILVDPDFVAAAPPALNLGGLADILCGYNAVGDWMLAHETVHERMPKNAPGKVHELCQDLQDQVSTRLPLTAAGIPFLVESFVNALSICWGLLSGRPVEGSEHFLYYALEEKFDRPLNHGAVIALNTLACLLLRGKQSLIDPTDLRKFYKRLGIPHTLSAIGIPADLYASIISEMPTFVRAKKLGFSLWDIKPSILPESVTGVTDWLK